MCTDVHRWARMHAPLSLTQCSFLQGRACTNLQGAVEAAAVVCSALVVSWRVGWQQTEVYSDDTRECVLKFIWANMHGSPPMGIWKGREEVVQDPFWSRFEQRTVRSEYS